MTRRAYSYLRFSSRQQATGDSIRRQVEMARSWCQRNGYALDEDLTYRDLGKSGFHGKNLEKGAGLRLFLDAVEKGTIRAGSVLVVENLDRLSRAEVFRAVGVIGQILHAGVDIVTLDPEKRLTKDVDEMEIMWAVFDLMRSRRESAVKSTRSLAVWRRKRQRREKLGNAGPAWLRWNGTAYEVIPERVRVVRLIFDWAARGVGMWAIVRRLNEGGIPNIGRGRKGWNSSYVSIILSNRAVLGEYQPHRMVEGRRVPEGDPIEGYFPAIIPPDLFHRVQAAVRDRGARFRGRGAKLIQNLFTGLLRDARDGGPLCYYKGKKAHGRQDWLYVANGDAHRRRSDTPFVPFPYQELETALLLNLKELTPDDFFPSEKQEVAGELEAKGGELAEVKAKVKAIQARILTPGAKAEPYLPVLEELEGRREALQAEVDRLNGIRSAQEERGLADLQGLIDEMDRQPPERRREIRERLQGRIRRLVKEIWVLLSRHKCGRGTRWKYDRKAVVEIHFRNGSVRRFHVVVSEGRGIYSSESKGTIPLTSLPPEFPRKSESATIIVQDKAGRALI